MDQEAKMEERQVGNTAQIYQNFLQVQSKQNNQIQQQMLLILQQRQQQRACFYRKSGIFD